ncbi:MAG: hypothetical protein J7513_14290 [Solirubrobacteraceae bacterium]|nr:hypothetical protein [Solirubrobacteraceae bacterium]
MTMARLRTATLVAATAGAALVVAGPAAAETTPPVIQSFTLTGPATLDTTYDWVGLPARLRVTDAGSGVASVVVYSTYAKDPTAHPSSWPNSGWTNDTGPITRLSGTAADGIYEGTAGANGGTRGTWSLKIVAKDVDGNTTTLTTAQIAAKGWRSTFKSETTKAPAASKITSNVIYPWWGYPHIGANITLNQPAGTAFSNAAILVSANAACGTPTSPPISTGQGFIDKRFAEKCTVVYRAVNAAGTSPEATHSFW